MKRISTKDLNRLAEKYILDCIDNSGYTNKPVESPVDKLNFLFDCFLAEYWNHQSVYISKQKAFSDWIAGLPSSFHILFSNYDIIMLAKSWGSIPGNATGKEEEKILKNYFNFISVKTFQLFRKYGIDTL